jgi:hypothetical protein
MDDLAGQRPKSRDTRGLFTGIKEELIPKADTKVGAIGCKPVLDHVPETGLSKLAGAVPERSDARNH